MNNAQVAQRLKMLRKQKGVSIYEVAKACDITPAAVCMYECGERIPKDVIKIRLAKYFGESVGFIFFDEKCHET